jgi:hypothetical protein
MHSRADRPPGNAFASTGDIVLRITRTDDLPNLWGRADLYGRTRERGFEEIRYMGVNSVGLPVFRRRDVEIMTNETTLSRSGIGSTVATAQPAGNGVIMSGISMSPGQATMGALPPDTVEFTINPADGRVITVGDHGIEVLEFNAAGIRYRAW